MATRTTGFDRFNDALKSLDEQLQDLRERFDHGRHRIERDLRKRAERAAERNQDKLRKNVEHRVDSTRSQIYDVFGIASKSEVEKLHRRLNKISKQIHDLSEGRPVDHSEAHSEAV